MILFLYVFRDSRSRSRSPSYSKYDDWCARHTCTHLPRLSPLFFSPFSLWSIFFFLLGPANLFEIPSARFFFFKFAAHFFLVRNENRFVADVNGINTHTPPRTLQFFSLPIRFGEKVLILWSSSSLVYYFYYFNRKMSLERDKVAIEEEERQCDPLQTWRNARK